MFGIREWVSLCYKTLHHSGRDDQLRTHLENYLLFKPYNAGYKDVNIQRMIEAGCDDVPDGFRDIIVEYLNEFFTNALDCEISIRQVTCSCATIWLLQDKYKRKFVDPMAEDRSAFFDPPYGPAVSRPLPKYAAYQIGNEIEEAVVNSVNSVFSWLSGNR